MSATLINHSPDLLRLQNEGYSLQIVGGTALHLLVHIPYVNAERQVLWGTLVSPLSVSGETTIRPVSDTHQTWFIGEHPCNTDGTEITGIKHGTALTDFGSGIVVNHSFSAKPLNGVPYVDYHAKMTQYIAIISAPAHSIDPDATATNFRPVLNEDNQSVFLYADTASGRAGIGAITQKLAMPKVAIVGLGGTGSYILDLVAKTHVQEIHLFDGDVFCQHNAFRAPGAAALEELINPTKVDYFAGIYRKMRRGIIPHAYRVTQDNVQELVDFDFVFISVDNPTVRKIIVDALQAMGVPFIDVGMDVQTFRQESLMGQCRTTLSTPAKSDHIPDRVPLAEAQANGIYASNIQIADLNALNATLAVIKWKKYFGFYLDHMGEHHSVYTVGTHDLTKDART